MVIPQFKCDSVYLRLATPVESTDCVTSPGQWTLAWYSYHPDYSFCGESLHSFSPPPLHPPGPGGSCSPSPRCIMGVSLIHPPADCQRHHRRRALREAIIGQEPREGPGFLPCMETASEKSGCCRQNITPRYSPGPSQPNNGALVSRYLTRLAHVHRKYI